MNKKNLYRPNVAMIIVSHNYPQKKEIFLAQRNDLTNVWQFPQGGIDEGKELKEALLRELEEEIGTKWISYEFAPKIVNKMKPYVGQKHFFKLSYFSLSRKSKFS